MASYNLHIGLMAPNIAFTGETPRLQALGGSESATVYVAEALARRGHVLHVFTPHSLDAYGEEKTVLYNSVTYHALPQSANLFQEYDFDVFIVSRDFTKLTIRRLKTKLLGLWNHDVLVNPDAFVEHIHAADFIWCLSEFHKRQFVSKLENHLDMTPFIDVTRNGVDLSCISSMIRMEKHAHPVFYYGSRPERGLVPLLAHVWPLILDKVPEAELRVSCYDVEQELLPEAVRAVHREAARLMDSTPHVTNLGSLKKSDYLHQLQRAWFMLYPSTFPEVSCISALEAQALGTPVLGSEYGALPETLIYPSLCLFDKTKIEQRDQEHILSCVGIIENSVKTYNNGHWMFHRTSMSDQVRVRSSWDSVAEEWELFFYHRFKTRSMTKGGKRVVQNLIYHSDLVAAKLALGAISRVPYQRENEIDSHAWNQLNEKVVDLLEHQHAEPEQYADYVDSYGSEGEDITVPLDRLMIAIEHIKAFFGGRTDVPFTCYDIGVGGGRFIYHLLKTFPNAKVQGVDFSQRIIDHAKHNLSPYMDVSACFQFGDFFDLPVPVEEDRAHVVFCGENLEHQQQLIEFLERLRLWVKPEGLMVFTTPTGPWEALSFGRAHTKDGHEIQFHVNHLEMRDLQELFADFTMRLEHVTVIQRSPLDTSLLGGWVTSVVNNTTGSIHAIDYQRKFETTRPYVTTAAFLMSYNEEDNITRALKPLQRRFDHVLLQDHGSTDQTRLLASSLTTTMLLYEWKDDFSDARNNALRYIREHMDVDYVYWQDCDECVIHPERIKSYISSDLGIFEAFVIKQCQLMLDMPMTIDLPIRLFKNEPEYAFYGCIHEQLQSDLNELIQPRLILSDVQVAHYGYQTEMERRQKVIDRNYRLLVKDREVNPGRKLGKIFLMRDYFHFLIWQIERNSEYLTPKSVFYAHEIVEMFKDFPDPEDPFHQLGRIFYEGALGNLVRFGVLTRRGHTPFQIAFTMMGAKGELSDADRKPTFFWFETVEEGRAYVTKLQERLWKQLEAKDEFLL